MRTLVIVASITLLLISHTFAQSNSVDSDLGDLKNLQIHGELFSAGLPTKKHFTALKTMGVTKVIDLIPGDRSEEKELMQTLGLEYHNIPVDWENPTLENFQSYLKLMQQENQGKVLTHCKLNWRGSAFTYLYRVTQLNVSEPEAKKEMLKIWQPNDTWQNFIDEVLVKYPQNNH